MGSLFSKVWSQFVGTKEMRILMVGLDAAGKEALLELLADATAHGSTVVVATHELSFVHTVSRVIALRDGRLVYDGGTDGINVDGLVRTEDPAGEHDGEQH